MASAGNTSGAAPGPAAGVGRPVGMPETPGGERTIGQLVADASKDVSTIVRSEIALAKAELQRDAQAAAVGGGMFVAAGVLAFLALILLLIAAAFGLVAAGLSPWLAFLIVACVLLLIGVILVLVGRSRLRKIKPPERTIRTSKETVAALTQRRPPDA